MLFRCSKCGKFRKYGTWVDVPERLLTQIQNVPISYVLCPNCEELKASAENLLLTGSSRSLMYTDGGRIKEDCHCNDGNGARTFNKRFCACGNR